MQRAPTMMTEEKQLEKNRKTLVKVLRRACRRLGVKIISPCVVADQSGFKTVYPAFIPEFGSARGTVIDVLDAPRTERETGLGIYGEENFISRSSINLLAIQRDSLKNVTEMLLEWGYYGDPQRAPRFVKARFDGK